MTKKLLSTICSISTAILLTGYFVVPPAWSAPGDKKPSIQKPADKNSKELGERKNSDKGKESVKKKVVKKAGTAAVIGVAATKVKSGAKEAVKKVVE
jgi:hypothetical protein